MKCACIYVNTDDGPTLFTETDPRANKTHVCTECKRTIMPGELYKHEQGLWDARWETYKTCSDCLSVRNEMFCEGYTYKELWHDVKEYVWDADGLISSECLLSLTPVARDRIFKLMDEVFMEDE